MFTSFLVVALCVANIETGSVCTFTVVAESMYLNVDNIGSGNLPVYIEL